MEKQIIEVTIDKDGKVKLELKNFKGLDCINETKDIEENLGKTIKKEITINKNTSNNQKIIKIKK